MRHKRNVPHQLPSGRWAVEIKCEDGEVRRFTTHAARPLRRPVSLRFDVLARDEYTCRYCGRKAPDVVLHVDHIVPVARGGTNEPANLVTACRDCNEGKGPRHSGAVVDPRPDLYESRGELNRQAMMKLADVGRDG